MEIMIPVWATELSSTRARSSLTSLKGAKVALVDDGYDAPYTDQVADTLRADFGADVIVFHKPHGSKGSPESLIDEAARCDVAVVGMAM